MTLTVELMKQKLATGVSFAQLSNEEKVFTANILRPTPGQPFTEEQREIMEQFMLIVPVAKLLKLDELNEGEQNKAQPITLVDGTKVLPSSLLSDTRPGENYDRARDFLFTLKFRKVSSEDFPKSEI